MLTIFDFIAPQKHIDLTYVKPSDIVKRVQLKRAASIEKYFGKKQTKQQSAVR